MHVHSRPELDTTLPGMAESMCDEGQVFTVELSHNPVIHNQDFVALPNELVSDTALTMNPLAKT